MLNAMTDSNNNRIYREKRMKLLLVILAVLISGCSNVSTEPGMESVIWDKPWFIGHGGIRDDTQKPGAGWYWFSTSLIDVPLTPIKYEEPLDHLPTADNNFINYQSYLLLQWTDPAYMVKTFGGPSDSKHYVTAEWYAHNIKEQYRTIVRDVTKQFQMTLIMTDQKTLIEIERQVAERLRALIVESGLKVKLVNVNMGKALPNQVVINEMDSTAAQQQRIKTEGQRKLAEDSRMKAEQSRAAADNAYRNEMHLDPSQFLTLEAIKQYSAACAQSTCIIGTVPVVVGKQ